MQQHRLIRINQDLRHRIGVMEAQGKALIQQRAELEATAQAQQQELGALQLEVTRLRKELRGWELEREVTDIEEMSLIRSGMSSPTSPQMAVRRRKRIYLEQAVNSIIRLKLCLDVLCYKSSLQQQHHLTPSNQIQCGWSVEGTLTSWQTALSVTRVLPFSQGRLTEKIMRKRVTKIRTLQHCFG